MVTLVTESPLADSSWLWMWFDIEAALIVASKSILFALGQTPLWASLTPANEAFGVISEIRAVL
ncbi:hypothetical protein [Acidithrix sp. C25]|uniref:hypothetical protein n=1 Tax=Acidithrix sp. C25 TaxID=1671482 RepID=UPI00191BB04C|nr:hypothetical protein [Acidithrix sp. C25]